MQTIRPYNTSDIEQVVKLWWNTWIITFPEIKHPQSYSSWKARFQNDLTLNGNIWVAVESSIAGLISEQ